jgi:amino acid transporter
MDVEWTPAAAVRPPSAGHFWTGRRKIGMGKVLAILIGLILIVVGIWGIYAWSADVLAFVKAGVVVMLVIVGLGIFVFGLSELRAGAEEPTVTEPPPAPGQPTEGASSETSQD